MKTKYEVEFFNFIEKVHFLYDEEENISLKPLEQLNFDLFSIEELFNIEILENITHLQKDDRIFYLNRLKKRLSRESEINFGIRLIGSNNDPKSTIEFEELEKWDRIVKDYQSRMKQFIENLLDTSSQNNEDINTENISRTISNDEIELIELNYPQETHDKIINYLYKKLNKHLFLLDFKSFERHFIDNNSEFKHIPWLGSEPQLVALFEGLDINNINQYKLIVDHFYNAEKEKPYNNKQLSVVSQKLANLRRPLKIIPSLLEEIQLLKS